MTSTLLGLETGGTRSTLLVTTVEGDLIEKHTLGPGNSRLLGDVGLHKLFEECESLAPQPRAIGFGMAGVRDARDCASIRKIAEKIWPGVRMWVDHDLASALMVAQRSFKDTTAHVLVLSGTGSCCFGRGLQGKEAKCGGWGHHLGDRGSAYDLAHTAIRKVIEVFDQTGKWPKLGERLLHASMHNEPNDWIQWFQTAQKSEVAALAVPVFEAWKQRDALAGKVIHQAAELLAADAHACAERLNDSGPGFVVAGGMFLKQTSFTKLFQKKLRAKRRNARVHVIPQESVWGTIYAAQSLLDQQSAEGRAKTSARLIPSRKTPPARKDVLPSSNGISLTERRLDASMNLDSMSGSQALDLFIDEDASIPEAIRKEKKNLLKWIRWTTEAFERGGRLFYVGAGTSGRLGVLDASECPPTFGVSSEMVQGIMAGGSTALWNAVEGAEDDFEAGWRALGLRGFCQKDLVLGIAASGRTPFVHGALAYARSMEARQGLLCFNPHLKWPRLHRPDVILCPLTGPEILTGSTRLKAGTATKLVLNMITTLAMVGIGKVKSNLMIDVQATNEKLRDRAARMVVTLTGAEYDIAVRALEQSAWKIQKACLKLEKRVSR
jgi:N-acetylmuramic acid 6-phosphate etherase